MKKQEFHIMCRYRGCASNLYCSSPKQYKKFLDDFIDFTVKKSSNCSICPICKRINYNTKHSKIGELLYTNCSIHGNFISYKQEFSDQFTTMTIRDSINNDFFGPFFYRESDWMDYANNLESVHKLTKGRHIKVRLLNKNNKVEFVLTPETLAESVWYLNRFFRKGGVINEKRKCGKPINRRRGETK